MDTAGNPSYLGRHSTKFLVTGCYLPRARKALALAQEIHVGHSPMIRLPSLAFVFWSPAGVLSPARFVAPSDDKRPALMVLVLLVLFFVLSAITLGDQLFGLKLLPRPTDYLVVGLAVLAWLVLANLFWWFASHWGWWLGDHRSAEGIHR